LNLKNQIKRAKKEKKSKKGDKEKKTPDKKAGKKKGATAAEIQAENTKRKISESLEEILKFQMNQAMLFNAFGYKSEISELKLVTFLKALQYVDMKSRDLSEELQFEFVVAGQKIIYYLENAAAVAKPAAAAEPDEKKS